MRNILYKQKVKSQRIEIFERHVKLQADSRRIRGARDTIRIFIGLKKLVSIKTTHALYRDNGLLRPKLGISVLIKTSQAAKRLS